MSQKGISLKNMFIVTHYDLILSETGQLMYKDNLQSQNTLNVSAILLQL